MLDQITNGPLLWFANRGTGVVLIGLLTLSTAMGVMSTARAGTTRWPRFATQALHRNVSLLTAAMLALHVTTAVVDGYVDIRWYDAIIPVGATYEPFWLGLGTLALDLMLAVVVTSLVRHRLNYKAWRVIHVLAYASWAIGVLHGIGIGHDSGTTWGMAVTVVSVAVVGAVAVIRVATYAHERRLAA